MDPMTTADVVSNLPSALFASFIMGLGGRIVVMGFNWLDGYMKRH